MTLYPLAHIHPPGDAAGEWLEWGDIDSMSCSKARGQAAGSWSVTPAETYRREMLRTIREDCLVELYRYRMESGDPELLMAGFAGPNECGAWNKDANGGITFSNRLSGQDFGKAFISNQQYHAPYMGIIPKTEAYKAFQDNPIFGASSVGDIGKYGDPGSIIRAVTKTFLLNDEPSSEFWGVDTLLSTGERLASRLSLDGVKYMNSPPSPLAAADPFVMWAYGVFDASGLYGSTWQALEKVVARGYQELWIESAMIEGAPGAILNFDLLPFWCFDHPEMWDLPEDALRLNFDNGWGYQPRLESKERFNFFSCIPRMMLGAASLAYQYTDSYFYADYPQTKQSFTFRFPIRERKGAAYGENYHWLKRCETEVQSLAWGLTGVDQEMIKDSMRRLNLRLWDYYFAMHEMYKASFTLRHEGAWPKPRQFVLYEPENLQYTIESSSTSWSRGEGFTDTLQLNRGISREKFFELLFDRNARYASGESR